MQKYINNMHLLTPVIISYLALNILKKKIFKFILFSIIFGLLVLIKSLYSFYLAILIFLLLKKIFYCLQSFIHLIPLIICLIFETKI